MCRGAEGGRQRGDKIDSGIERDVVITGSVTDVNLRSAAAYIGEDGSFYTDSVFVGVSAPRLRRWLAVCR